MKLKKTPEDFVVEELSDVTLGDGGSFAYYRLEKRDWTTPDAIAAISSRWHLEPSRIAFGGLKDRHAHTIQYLTVHNGPRRGLSQKGLTLRYLGQTNAPYSSQHIRSNRFCITLRNLMEPDVDAVVGATDAIRRDGVPNYFDDQRFGSLSGGQEFVGKLMVQGRFEDAVRLALTAPYEFDRARDQHAKSVLHDHWGKWTECRRQLPGRQFHRLLTHLEHHPDDFRGAVTLLRPELQGLYLSAYQSHLWNRILAARLADLVSREHVRPIQIKTGELPVPIQLDDNQRARLIAERIPLPAARWPFDASAPWADATRKVLAEEGLTWDDLKVKGVRKPFFARGDRAAVVTPASLVAESGDDEVHRGRLLVRLTFELPRGSYATIVIKRLMAGV